MLMRMCARYHSSFVCEEIFERCAPTRARRNIIYFIYILIGPHSHGSTENLSHHSSAIFIGSPFLSFSLPPSNLPLCFQASFRSLLKDRTSFLDLSNAPLHTSLIPTLILFFHFSFFSRASFPTLSYDLRVIFSPALILYM